MKTYQITAEQCPPCANDPQGITTTIYRKGDEVVAAGLWLEQIMDFFVSEGWAQELKVAAPVETGVAVEAEVVEETPKPKRRGRRKKADSE